jgi:hypothetical protein
MFLPLQYDELHLKAWSWLRNKLFQRHVRFGVECGLVQYENKVRTLKGIHLVNFQGANNPKGVLKPSQNDHLLINAACIGTPI